MCLITSQLMYMDEIPSDSSLISPAPIALKAGHSGDCLPEQQQQSHLDIVNPKKRLENAALDFTDDAKEASAGAILLLSLLLLLVLMFLLFMFMLMIIMIIMMNMVTTMLTTTMIDDDCSN